MTLRKQMTAGLLALSIALPLGLAAPAPARAANEGEVIGAVLGIAALIALANELDDDDRKRNRGPAYSRPRDRDHWDRPSYRHGRKTLPRECIRRVETRNGPRRFLGKGCARREGYHRPLPQACKAHRASNRTGRSIYRVGCLRNRGYRFAYH